MHCQLPILLWRVQTFAMLVHDWKIAHHAGSPEICFGRPATELQIAATQKDCVPISTKKEYSLSSECVAGLVWIPETNLLSSQGASSTYCTCILKNLPSKRSWLCWSVLEVRHKDGKSYPLCYTSVAMGLYVTLFANSTLPCTSITSLGKGTWSNSASVSESS